MTTRVLVVGGRGFRDAHLLYSVLDQVHIATGDMCVVTWGDTIGAASIARRWAHTRNVLWVDNLFSDLDLVIAFPGTGIEKALQHAWKRRIPAVKIMADGSRVRVGAGLPNRFFQVRKVRP